jgi:hypothetical protein
MEPRAETPDRLRSGIGELPATSLSRLTECSGSTPSHSVELPSPDLPPFGLYLRAVLSPFLQFSRQFGPSATPRPNGVCKYLSRPSGHRTATHPPALDSAVRHTPAKQFDHAAANARVIPNRPRQKPSHLMLLTLFSMSRVVFVTSSTYQRLSNN